LSTRRFWSASTATAASFSFTGRRGNLEYFGVSQIRVLTITDCTKRVDQMLDVVNEITGGKGTNFLLFAAPDELQDSVLSATWAMGSAVRCSTEPCRMQRKSPASTPARAFPQCKKETSARHERYNSRRPRLRRRRARPTAIIQACSTPHSPTRYAMLVAECRSLPADWAGVIRPLTLPAAASPSSCRRYWMRARQVLQSATGVGRAHRFVPHRLSVSPVRRRR
jgi:hypothetical protein